MFITVENDFINAKIGYHLCRAKSLTTDEVRQKCDRKIESMFGMHLVVI